MYPLIISKCDVKVNLSVEAPEKSILAIFKFFHKKFYYHKTAEDIAEELEEIKGTIVGISHKELSDIVESLVRDYLQSKAYGQYFNLDLLKARIYMILGDDIYVPNLNKKQNFNDHYTPEEYKKLFSTVGEIIVT